MVCPVRTKAVSTECEWFPDWEDPNDCDCPHDGYSNNDGCYKFPIEINGQCEWRIGKSLTTTKNKDHPLTGAGKANPTWDVRSMCGWFAKDGAQGPQGPQGPTGADGATGAAGADGTNFGATDACTGAALAPGSAVVTRDNPVSSGGFWIGGKTQAGGSTPLVPGTEYPLDYTNNVIYGGAGAPVSADASGITVLKAGVFDSIAARLGVTDACNEDADMSSTYQLEVFVNGVSHNKVDFTMNGTQDGVGIAEGADANKPIKPIIAAIGDVITGIVTVEAGAGGHCISSTQLSAHYDGCGQQY